MMGEDFDFSCAEKLFYSMDRLMNDINAENHGFKVKYSTANEYMDAVKNSGVKLSNYKHNADFFPVSWLEDGQRYAYDDPDINKGGFLLGLRKSNQTFT
jgi:hypothetical protein